ncbi:MAG: radical SAM protein [Euryarchaeota archaeon]|nr:radical SAM protein [Euryarchaeota archaeon]
MRYSPLRHLPQVLLKRPVQLTFFVTARCNSACSFCFYLSGKRRRGSELSLEEIERFAASTPELLWLAFSGGEVFLREDIVEIAELFYRHTKPVIMLLPTNGLLPERIAECVEEILRRCRRSTVTVKLSLDGVGEEHDRIRGVRGNFERVMESYRLLSPLLEKYPNFELGINTVLCAANQHRVEEVFEYVSRLEHIKTHTLSLIRGDVSREMKRVDLERYRELIEKLERDLRSGKSRMYRFPGARLKAAQDVLQRRLIYLTAREGRRLIPCYAGRLNLVVTEEGDVYPCELLNAKMGSLREHDCDLRRVLRSPRARRVVEEIKRGGCYCTHECYFITNILFNPRLYPALLREYIKLVV